MSGAAFLLILLLLLPLFRRGKPRRGGGYCRVARKPVGPPPPTPGPNRNSLRPSTAVQDVQGVQEKENVSLNSEETGEKRKEES